MGKVILNIHIVGPDLDLRMKERKFPHSPQNCQTFLYSRGPQVFVKIFI